MILHWNMAPFNVLSPAFLLVVSTLIHHCQSLASDCLKLSEKDGPVLFCQACLSQLPLPSSEIPTKIAKLRIIGQSPDSPHNGRLTRYNLSGLETLTYLEIGNFNLHEIESDTFSAMRFLKVLDLSKNQITNIRPGAFNALSLNLLSLTDNRGLILSRLSFRGAKIYHFVARNCDLRELDYETIAEARPKQISLSDNKIQWLEPRFANLISERKTMRHSSTKSVSPTSAMTDNQPFHYTWGYLDLTNNPLNCDCQLIWLSRLIEAQLYDSQRYLSSSKDSQSLPDAFTNDTPVRLMHQMNFTCASPPHRIGKRLPRSWEYYCPHPSVVGIDIHWLTSGFDMAQLTCIGKGKPAPSLAWTYKVDGQKVQQILDPFTKPYLLATTPNRGYAYLSDPTITTTTSGSSSSSSSIGPEQLSERKLTVNVSLKSLENHNFTCTVWNDDNYYQHNRQTGLDSMGYLSAESTDIINKPQPSPLIVPSLTHGDSSLADQYRLHEVVLRVIGPGKLTGTPIPPVQPPPRRPPLTLVQSAAIGSPSQTQTSDNDVLLTKTNTQNPHSAQDLKTTVALERVDRDPSYGYLFVKRFTLLELLGAIIGTFICTLALLYLVTHCLSWVCQLEPWPMKPSSKSHLMKSSVATNSKCLDWFRSPRGSLLKSAHPSGSTSSNTSHGPLDHADSKLLHRHDLETCSSFMNSTGTTNFSKPGLATVALRHANSIPPALLLTSVPVPPLECSATPPPNPAYWPMPEYTYSGTGSHEYDVPRPLESFNTVTPSNANNHNSNGNNNNGTSTTGKILVRNSLFESGNDATNHSFLNLNNSSQLGHLNNQFQTGGPIASSLSLHWSPVQNSLNLAPQTMIWHSNPNPNGHLNLTSPGELTIPSGTYTATQSMLYSTDYPTYLQTRPYPHHQQQPQQPLIDLINNGGTGHNNYRPDSGFNGLMVGKQQTIPTRMTESQLHLAESDA